VVTSAAENALLQKALVRAARHRLASFVIEVKQLSRALVIARADFST
jgi:hypothetical protein